MKILITFLKLWFGMISECWQDAKIINDKKCQQTFKDLCDAIDETNKKSKESLKTWNDQDINDYKINDSLN